MLHTRSRLEGMTGLIASSSNFAPDPSTLFFALDYSKLLFGPDPSILFLLSGLAFAAGFSFSRLFVSFLFLGHRPFVVSPRGRV